MANPGSKNSGELSRATLTVRACLIRDGTPGISLSMGREVIGEWADSRVGTLLLTNDFKVAICGAGGDQLYLFSVPGKPLSAEQVSDTGVTINFEI